MTKKEVRSTIAQYIIDNPQLSYKAIGQMLNCAVSTISNIAREYKITRQRAALNDADLLNLR